MANEMRDAFETFKKPEGSGKAWRQFESHLELLEKGLRHELAMCQLVEDNGFAFIKRFESHDRVPKDYRKRAEADSAEFKKEKQAASKPKPAAGPSKAKQEAGPRSGPGKPKGCWNCDSMAHHKRDCPHPLRVRPKRD